MIEVSALGLSASQLANARGIITAVKKDDRFNEDPRKAAVIAIETAMTESGMRMIASANVPESQKYPHEAVTWTDDGLGHDHASMGMFQQQTGTQWTPAGFGSSMSQTTIDNPNGWGTPAELMNAEKSTAKFLNALAAVDWQHMTNWAAAQAVQHSGFADGSNYRKADAAAQQVVDVLWDHVRPEEAAAHRLSGEDEVMFMIQNDKAKGGNDGICLVMAAGAKVIHDTAAVTAYKAAGIPGPIPVSPAEFKSFPRVGS